MKGIVFTEFMELVEARWGDEMSDDILDANPPSGGAYTAMGTYPHSELVALVVALAERTEVPADQLVQSFGQHLAGRFRVLYPSFFTACPDYFSFLESVHGYIHVEVHKLYPDAELPRFECHRPGPGQLLMKYSSARPFHQLALGLLEGTADLYGENVQIEVTDRSENGLTKADFLITALSGRS